MLDAVKKQLNLANLIFAFALIQAGWLIWYYYTGYGGPQELVARVMSIAPSWHCFVLPFSTGSWSSVTGASVIVLWSIQTWSAPRMVIAS